MGILRHVGAIVLLPFTVTIVVPSLLVHRTDSTHIGWGLPTPLCYFPTVIGFSVICLGLVLSIGSFVLFATIGRGTLAPWDPPQKLVVTGVYRHVRNPMISGIVFILWGEAFLTGSPALFCWSILFFAANVIYIPLVEEPGLDRRFGKDYTVYKANVPRWIPRLKPWADPNKSCTNTGSSA